MKNIVRRILRTLLAAKLWGRSRPLALSGNGTALVIAPHPDDEALGCGALLARLASSGVRIEIAYFTDGEGSHPGHPTLRPSDLASLRRSEAQHAMRGIGIPEDQLHFCGAPDGRLKSLSADESKIWTQCIKDLIIETRPTELLLPCRDDGSSEHEAVFVLLERAIATLPVAPPRVLEFPVWSWWSPRHLAKVAQRRGLVWRQAADTYAAQKRALLRNYPSQTTSLPPFSEPVLSAAFLKAFDGGNEYFFEMPLSHRNDDAE